MFGREPRKKLLTNSCFLSIFLNILTICIGISYFLIPISGILLDIFGIILVFSWIINILIIYLDDKFLNKSTVPGKNLNKLTYYYIAFFILGILFIMISIFISNFLLIGEMSSLLLSFIYLDLFIGLIGIALFGLIVAMKNISNIEKRGVFHFE